MQPGEDSGIGEVGCKCDRMDAEITSYSGGFTAPTVNPIDFKNIADNFLELLAGAPAVFSTIIVLLVLYLVGGIIARRADKKDVERVG